MAQEGVYPPFDPKGNLYEQNSFVGRLQHFLNVTDMRTLFTTQEELDAAVNMLKKYKEGTLSPRPSDEELWKAKKICDAIIHPDTGEKIFLPFRLSAFVPINVLVCAGLVMPNPSVGATIFWQWINQSYNIALNHANRNASNTMTNEQIAISYVTAVTVSCSVALGMRKLVDTAFATFRESVKNSIRMFIPFTAVSIAGVANVCIMRRNEMKDGIQIKDEEGNVLGNSAVAGKRAVAQVCLSRVLTSLPVLIIPPYAMSALDRVKFFRNNPRMKIPLNLALIGGILLTSLPAATALFPQHSSLSVDQLEPQFRGLTSKSGAPIRTAYYNKGL